MRRKVSAEEFFRFYPEESWLELLEGEVCEMPAPNGLWRRWV
ncbi:MAG: hypothetical protein N3C13_03845 [Aquificaceae bacterium]|nr:hypothetical protein [Aquificaceae bacterium]MCX8060314.1 hypothetical protein [Aquificaceae bacterium]MDW8097053.1 hypothetical protein [Aquificaceae bacterium]